MTEPANTNELVQRGKAAARIGRLDEARDYLRRAVQQTPGHAEAWMTLAAVEVDPTQKIACFETVLDLEPDNAEAQLALEMLQDDTGETTPETAESQAELEAVIAAASRRLDDAVGPPPADKVPLDDEPLYCDNHPNVETLLRCNRCNKPICTRCAVQTPVGYRCKQCVGQQQSVFYTGGPVDYVIGGVIALLLGGIASALISSIGWFFALILGAPIGIGVAEVVRFAVRRRRSKYLWMVVAGGLVVSALPALLWTIFGFMAISGMGGQQAPIFAFQPLITIGIYLVLAVGAVAARLR